MSPSREAILTSPITLRNRSIWFTEIELYREGIVISGWTWTGPVTERFPAGEIDLVEKWTVTLGPNFRLRPADRRQPAFGRIHRGAKFWELALDRHERIDLQLRH